MPFSIGCQKDEKRFDFLVILFVNIFLCQYISLLAAAKLGLFVTDLDPAIVSVANIRKILFLVQPRMIVFDPECGNNRLDLLRQSIPEFYHCAAIKVFFLSLFP